MPLYTYWLGRRSYAEGLNWQMWARERAEEGECVLLLLEHEPVFTIGRGGSLTSFRIQPEELLNQGIEIWKIGRGGDVTYHGPGQLVGYPIFPLREHDLSVIHFLRLIEDVLIESLGQFQIHARRIKGKTGVWCSDAKIASIGIRVARGISAHGFALNVRRTVEPFQYIYPCGMDITVVSMEELTHQRLHVMTPCTTIAECFARTLEHEKWTFENFAHQKAPAMTLHVSSSEEFPFMKESPL